jgi:alpha-L-fucosidase 2
MQSHEGFIELLPALPEAWETGSFKGLVARGNFEIAAIWENSTISSVEITANVGGECRFRFPNPERINITDESGNKIQFSHEENDVIKFNTYKKGRYTIYFA